MREFNAAVAGFINPTTFFGVAVTGGDDIGRINLFATSIGDEFSGTDNIDVYTQDVIENVVPEPTTALLFGLGLLGLTGIDRRKK